MTTPECPPCSTCGHTKAQHKRRSTAKLGDWFRVCVEQTDVKSVCGCFVYDPRPAADVPTTSDNGTDAEDRREEFLRKGHKAWLNHRHLFDEQDQAEIYGKHDSAPCARCSDNGTGE
jgi:hypothetical protein